MHLDPGWELELGLVFLWLMYWSSREPRGCSEVYPLGEAGRRAGWAARWASEPYCIEPQEWPMNMPLRGREGEGMKHFKDKEKNKGRSAES